MLLQRAWEPVLWGQKDVMQFQIKWYLFNTNNTYFIPLVWTCFCLGVFGRFWEFFFKELSLKRQKEAFLMCVNFETKHSFLVIYERLSWLTLRVLLISLIIISLLLPTVQTRKSNSKYNMILKVCFIILLLASSHCVFRWQGKVPGTQQYSENCFD